MIGLIDVIAWFAAAALFCAISSKHKIEDEQEWPRCFVFSTGSTPPAVRNGVDFSVFSQSNGIINTQPNRRNPNEKAKEST